MTKQPKTLKKIRPFEEVLQSYRDVVHESEMFINLQKELTEYKKDIENIRCLAIGSFSDDFPARYQLALLLELIQVLTEEDKTIRVSIYDPIFNETDFKYIKTAYPTWVTTETVDKEIFNPKSTLYFLPHAPLDLTEFILRTEEPKLYLANNIVQHTDRYTKSQLNEKYPLLSKLLNVLEAQKQKEPKKDPVSSASDGFTAFVSKRNRKQKSKYKFVEKRIDYESIPSNFSKCTIKTTFSDGKLLKDKPWVNSFSDLTMHVIE
ncbi:hypothetical protein C6P45_003053 [Maudiozyma exigua]|uniref:SRR1-like domain-containing protein n=1 Tax=Maudiozyma exigua TaxID=34358 RepID=A0A9P6WES6_MAUEX|nr:hypothetical protein C6P45_003053 [Kazachstania exigua]